jgi:S-formylglutathione hydrolase FrmB
LKDNLLHEPLEQAVKIYLPPSYADSGLRYPVVYFLPGYGGSNDGDSNYFPVEELANLIAGGQLSEMILVVPNGKNVLHGGFYVNSPVTGGWEDFIVKDVVGYVDANFRTIPGPEGRGIGGHSMGGFGALNLSMRHPDIFGAAYCLSPAFFDEQGLKDSMMFDKDKKIDQFLAEQEKLSQMPEDEAIRTMAEYESPLGFTMAYGAAFAPNAEKGPPFFDYPYNLVDGEAKKNHKLWVQWENGLGGWGEKIWEHRDNLAQLRGIVIDYGTQDRYNWIPTGSEYVSRMLSEAGIPNQLYQFDGGHGDRLVERVVTVMLPFFDEVLVDAR